MEMDSLLDAYFGSIECELLVDGTWRPYCYIKEMHVAHELLVLTFLGAPEVAMLSFEKARTHLRKRVIVSSDTQYVGMLPEGAQEVEGRGHGR